MNPSIELLDGLTLVRAAGRIDFEAAAAFQGLLDQAMAQTTDRPANLVIDCAAVDYVSSAGLRVFLMTARAAKQAGIGFVVCALQPSVKEVFDVSGCSRIIDIRLDTAAAGVPRRA